MPITVRVTDGGLGFIMEGDGAVTGEEILAGVDERFSSEDKIRKYIYGMSDYTKVTSIDMESDQIRLVAEKDERVSKLNPDLVIAIAAPQDLMYGLCRIFEAYAADTGWEIRVRRSMEDAKKGVLEMLKSKGRDVDRIEFA
jgi:hypothetical protein